MGNKEYLTNKEVSLITGVKACHVAREFRNARHGTYIFCGKQCQSYLKEDVIKIKQQMDDRKKRASDRYKKRPDIQLKKPSRYSNILPKDTYLKLRNAWYGMMRRCYTEDRPDYAHYRAEKISMCKEWLEDKDNFIEWSLNNGFQMDLSIDRIDNDGDYCPENCRWANRITQGNNTSVNKKFEYNGELLTVGEMANRFGLDYSFLWNRLSKSRMSVEDAILKKKRPGTQPSVFVTYKGEHRPLCDVAKENKVDYNVMLSRVKRGWPVEKAISTPIKKLAKYSRKK